MNRDRLTDTLNLYEACNLNRHDVDGIDHVGWGINVEEQLADELLEYLGVEDEDDIQSVTQEQADYLRDWFIDNSIKDCHAIYGEDFFNGLSDLRQEVLVNLAYNLGISRLKGFRKMNKAVLAEDWAEAAAQMLDSKAARQTGTRYQKLAGALEHDDEKYLELSNCYDVVAADIPEGNSDIEARDTDELLIELHQITAELNRRLKNNTLLV